MARPYLKTKIKQNKNKMKMKSSNTIKILKHMEGVLGGAGQHTRTKVPADKDLACENRDFWHAVSMDFVNYC